MVKVIDHGLLPPDHPIYQRGWTTVCIPSLNGMFGTPAKPAPPANGGGNDNTPTQAQTTAPAASAPCTTNADDAAGNLEKAPSNRQKNVKSRKGRHVRRTHKKNRSVSPDEEVE